MLIQGESGTGKELIADLIHQQHARAARDGPFVEINCASLPENLLESELFGYERGAFTDAKAQKRGLFEEADGGTLFLDEIGEMPLGTQAKLLKVLEEMTFRRLGGTRDLRSTCASSPPPTRIWPTRSSGAPSGSTSTTGSTSSTLRLPPLRERREDILPLARTSWHASPRACASRPLAFAPETERILRAYDYPGNVRELRNLIERAVILSSARARSAPTASCSPARRARRRRDARTFFSIDLDDAGSRPTLEAPRARLHRAPARLRAGQPHARSRACSGVSYPTVAKKIADYGLA